MQLAKEQIEHIAKLSRLELSDEEIGRYGEQLNGILNYVSQLGEVNAGQVEPTAQVTGLKDVFRDDEIREWDTDEVDLALNDSPDREGRFVRVKRILE